MQKYSSDLDYLLNQLESIHPDLYRFYSKEKFYNDIDILKKKNIVDNKDFCFEIMRLLAKLKDSHTCIIPNVNAVFELKLINNEFYIVDDYKNKNSSYKYKKIKNINKVPVEQIRKKIDEFIAYDVEEWEKSRIEIYLLCEELLKYIGIVKDDFLIELDDGTLIDYNKELKKDYIIECLNYFENRKIDDSYYIKYGVCKGMNNIDLDSWFDSIIKDLKKYEPYNIIIDLRGNAGGNSKYFTSFSKKLSKEFDDMNYIVITDNGTFSSGIFALEEMIKLGAIHIGTSVGACKNHYGNIKLIKLSNCDITINCSDSYWVLKDNSFIGLNSEEIKSFADKKLLYNMEKIIPDIVIEKSLDDYINGTDCVLDFAIEYQKINPRIKR